MHKIAFFLFACLLVFCGCSDEDNITESEAIKISGDTVFVTPGSTSIQAAVDTAETGAIILVADGIYRGNGNRDISFGGKSVTVKSVNSPALTIIDCEGDSANPHQAFLLFQRENEAVIEGFTIRNGYAGNGGAINLRSVSPTIRNCIFQDNHAYSSGGAMRLKASSPDIINCTFVGNSSDMIGGAIFLLAGSSPHLQNCIIAFSDESEGIIPGEITSQPTFTCCNIYGNAGGDWVTEIADQAGINGNMSVDPQFCDTAGYDYSLQNSSPCVAGNNDCGELIGALEPECN
ncbi:MAG: DUF1565 domain-containing protein [FCB group bacterium]|nr:DUF1565 domain-containing protein [FCB group bacterium]